MAFGPFFRISRYYSEKVNGMVTVVLPDVTAPNVHRPTVVLTSSSKSPYPVVDDAMEMLMTSPLGEIVKRRVTFPANPGFVFKNLL